MNIFKKRSDEQIKQEEYHEYLLEKEHTENKLNKAKETVKHLENKLLIINDYLETNSF